MRSKLYAGRFPFAITDVELRELFSAHGTVASAQVIVDKVTGRSRGFGFVEMASVAEAQKAIQALNGADLNGRNIRVNEARPREGRAGGFGDHGGKRRADGSDRNRW